MLEVNMLGQYDIHLDGQPIKVNSQPARLLLAYLMLHAGQPIRREKVAGILWPDSLDSTARKNLRNYVWRLRKAIGEEYLLAEKETLTFNSQAAFRFDVHILQGGVDQEDGENLIQVVSVYQGEFLPGYDDDWVQFERIRLQTTFERHINTLLNQLATAEKWSDLVTWAEHWIAFGQTPEPAYRSLMIGYAGMGDQAGMATSYRRCHEALREELNVEPSAETRTLFERLSSRQKAKTISHSIDDSMPLCPYRGLFSFQEKDAPFFFGRELFTRKLVEAVQKRALVAVVGPSGSGKSSVLAAGLLAQMRQKPEWTMVTFRPGSDPFLNLTAALLPLIKPGLSKSERLVETKQMAYRLGNGEIHLSELVVEIRKQNRLLVLADQFEELYTLCSNRDVQHNFLATLLRLVQEQEFQSVPTISFLFALRADFLEQALTYRPLADGIQHGTFLLGPMIPAELRLAIEKPAKKQGVFFETGLVERILDDVGEAPGNLPLLEFALTSLWDQQQSGIISHNSYETNGRISGALTRHADQTINTLNPADQVNARRILVQLIKLGDHTDDSRRIAYRQEFDADDWRLIQHLADARLVVTTQDPMGNQTVELVHEALIRNWTKLHDWLIADRDFRIWQEKVRFTERQWQATNRDDGALLRGVPLAEAEDWLAKRGNDLSPPEQNFILASVAHRESNEKKRQQEQQSRERLRQRITVGAVVGLLIAVTLALLAGFQWQRAEQKSQELDTALVTVETALDEAQVALSGQLAALAQTRLEEQPDLALLLSLEALQIADTGEARSMLFTSLVTNSRLIRFLWGHTDRVTTVAYSPNGHQLASGSNDNSIMLWDTLSGEPLGQPLTGHTDNVLSIAFSPDGNLLASAGSDQVVLLWDVATGKMIGSPLTGYLDDVQSVKFSPDGNTLASSSERTIYLWDVSTLSNNRQLDGLPDRVTLNGHEDVVSSLAFSPDSRLLASGSNDNTIRLWDATSFSPIGPPIIGHSDWVRSVAFSPDGQLLASGSENGTIHLWEVAEKISLIQTLNGHTNSVRSIAFSPEPHPDTGHAVLASGSTDSTIILWDTTTGQALYPPFTGHSDWIRAVSFHPDGQTLASASHDGAIGLWGITGRDLGPLALKPPLNLHTDSVRTVAFSPDGRILASGSDDRSIILWDIANREPLGAPLTGHAASVQSIAFNPDGQILASGSNDHTIILWDMAKREPLGPPLSGHKASVSSIAFSPDGQLLASGSSDDTLIIWDMDSREPFGSPVEGFLEGVQDIAFSPDGQIMATAGDNKNIVLWNMQQNPEISETLTGHTDVVFSIDFSPDGLLLASGSWDNTIKLWDLSLGESMEPPLTGHSESVQDVAFSPDGQTLASASWDETVILWDIPGGVQLGPPLKGHTGSVRGIAFSPDGRVLATGGDDGTIILWDVHLKSWQARACHRANRNMSMVEWQQYFGNLPYRATCPDLLAAQ